MRTAALCAHDVTRRWIFYNAVLPYRATTALSRTSPCLFARQAGAVDLRVRADAPSADKVLRPFQSLAGVVVALSHDDPATDALTDHNALCIGAQRPCARSLRSGRSLAYPMLLAALETG